MGAQRFDVADGVRLSDDIDIVGEGNLRDLETKNGGGRASFESDGTMPLYLRESELRRVGE